MADKQDKLSTRLAATASDATRAAMDKETAITEIMVDGLTTTVTRMGKPAVVSLENSSPPPESPPVEPQEELVPRPRRRLKNTVRVLAVIAATGFPTPAL